MLYTPPIEAPYLNDREKELASGFMRWLGSNRKVENDYYFFTNLAIQYADSFAPGDPRRPTEMEAKGFLAYFAAWVSERIYVTYSDDEVFVVYFTHSDYPSLDKAVEAMLGYYEENPNG